MLKTGVLITGGTGYLGRGLVRELLKGTLADRICVFSRGEYQQALMRAEIPDPDGRLRWFIGDVRDHERLRRAMERVSLVIHAAALKRVEVGEYNPDEMVRTNVLGAMNVVNAARDAGVAKVVAVSTDKACAPLNAYGATKLTMEKLMLAANNASSSYGPRFAVVRYGNVSGSTGSVIPTWRALIKKAWAEFPNGSILDGKRVHLPDGKISGLEVKVRVTDPNCSRFWMRIEEAVELILWTAQNMEGGETVVPLLPAYRIGTLAQAMGLEMDIVGLGAGEKVDEMMVAPMESPEFRYVPPYLVRGGLAAKIPPNVGGIKLHELSVEELRELLEALPA